MISARTLDAALGQRRWQGLLRQRVKGGRLVDIQRFGERRCAEMTQRDKAGFAFSREHLAERLQLASGALVLARGQRQLDQRFLRERRTRFAEQGQWALYLFLLRQKRRCSPPQRGRALPKEAPLREE